MARQLRKMSKSDVLDREAEEAERARVAEGFDPTRCKHYAPGTTVTLANESYEVIEADDRRTTLLLRGVDGTERLVRRAGSWAAA